MSSIFDLLSLVRKSYLDVFRPALLENRKEHGAVASGTEVLMRYGDEAGLLRNLARIDFATKNNFIEINTENTTNLPSRITLESGLEVKISPLVWNGIEIDSVVFDVNDREILDWFDNWIDTAEVKHEDEFGLRGVIHQVHIQPTDGKTNLSVDFGSAPIEAALEFFQKLSAMGNREISIGSSWNEE